MPRRKNITYKPDLRLEMKAGELHEQATRLRQRLDETIAQRNKVWFVMHHANGYSQRRITEVTNARLPPNADGALTEWAIEKALLKMRG